MGLEGGCKAGAGRRDYSFLLVLHLFVCLYHPSFPGGSDSKNPTTMWETRIQPLGWEDPLEEEMATHSSIPAWRIPTDYNLWGRKELDTTERLSTTTQHHPSSVLPLGSSSSL